MALPTLALQVNSIRTYCTLMKACRFSQTSPFLLSLSSTLIWTLSSKSRRTFRLMEPLPFLCESAVVQGMHKTSGCGSHPSGSAQGPRLKCQADSPSGMQGHAVLMQPDPSMRPFSLTKLGRSARRCLQYLLKNTPEE